jgi:hypothetical protein
MQGDIDGSNTVFTVPSGFFPIVVDSETVFVRGLPRRRDNDDGWSVTDYSTGTFDLNEAPLDGDVVQIMFLQELPDGELAPLEGRIEPLGDLQGQLSVVGLEACLQSESLLCSATMAPQRLEGATEALSDINGRLEDC